MRSLVYPYIYAEPARTYSGGAKQVNNDILAACTSHTWGINVHIFIFISPLVQQFISDKHPLYRIAQSYSSCVYGVTHSTAFGGYYGVS